MQILFSYLFVQLKTQFVVHIGTHDNRKHFKQISNIKKSVTLLLMYLLPVCSIADTLLADAEEPGSTIFLVRVVVKIRSLDISVSGNNNKVAVVVVPPDFLFIWLDVPHLIYKHSSQDCIAG